YGKGDVDGDADITLSDAGIMLSCYADNAAGLASEINEIQKNAADMDKDGEITISDASTALSLYAEHAAGIIDTLILPPAVKEDKFYNYTLYSGDLESVFYLDIDSDGAKESIGRYINTNLENTFAMHCAPYVYQVYDNGRFVDTYGLDTNICRTQYVLIYDQNINETYLASLTEGGIESSFHFAVICREYPTLSSVMDYYFFEEGNEEFRIGNDLTDVNRAEFLEYISKLEIIDPYGCVDEDLYLFINHGFLT
ncbi:MAG: dockerin type I domain-containing protein, partial [Ruminococcus sp.]